MPTLWWPWLWPSRSTVMDCHQLPHFSVPVFPQVLPMTGSRAGEGESRTWSFWLVAGFLYRAPFTRGCPRASWDPCCSLSSLSLHRSSSAPLSEGSPCLPLLPPTHSYLGRSCNSWLCLAFAPQKTWSDTSVSWLLTLMFLPAPILLPL